MAPNHANESDRSDNGSRDEMPVETAADLVVMASSAGGEFAGRVIPDLDKTLGRGGQSTVYAAQLEGRDGKREEVALILPSENDGKTAQRYRDIATLIERIEANERRSVAAEARRSWAEATEWSAATGAARLQHYREAVTVDPPGAIPAELMRIRGFADCAAVSDVLAQTNMADGLATASSPVVPGILAERIRGETVEHAMERGVIDLVQGLRISAGVARLLERLHDHGVVNCDVKPSNLMLERTQLDARIYPMRPEAVLEAAGMTVAKAQAADGHSIKKTVSLSLMEESERADFIQAIERKVGRPFNLERDVVYLTRVDPGAKHVDVHIETGTIRRTVMIDLGSAMTHQEAIEMGQRGCGEGTIGHTDFTTLLNIPRNPTPGVEQADYLHSATVWSVAQVLGRTMGTEMAIDPLHPNPVADRESRRVALRQATAYVDQRYGGTLAKDMEMLLADATHPDPFSRMTLREFAFRAEQLAADCEAATQSN